MRVILSGARWLDEANGQETFVLAFQMFAVSFKAILHWKAGTAHPAPNPLPSPLLVRN